MNLEKLATVILYIDRSSRTSEGLCSVYNAGRLAVRLHLYTPGQWGELAFNAAVPPLTAEERAAIVERYRLRQLVVLDVLSPSDLSAQEWVDLAWDFSDAIEAGLGDSTWMTVLRARESQIRRVLARRRAA